MQLLGLKLIAQNRFQEYTLLSMNMAINNADVRSLLKYDGSKFLFVPGRFGNTPLHIAASAGHSKDLFPVLFLDKFSLSVRNDFGFTPFLIACSSSFLDTVQGLASLPLLNMLNVEYKWQDEIDIWGRNCLSIAQLLNDVPLIKYLLKNRYMFTACIFFPAWCN